MTTFFTHIFKQISNSSCMFLSIFIAGIAFIITGIRILRQKKVTLSAPKRGFFDWYKPETLKGNRSKYYGWYYLIFGSFLFLVSMIMIIGD
jgi:hypothetical protein